MAKYDKVLEKWRNNPYGVRFEELDGVLLRYGFSRRQPRGGSSHHVYTKPGRPPLTIAFKRPFVHHRAVREVLAVIDEIAAEE